MIEGNSTSKTRKQKLMNRNTISARSTSIIPVQVAEPEQIVGRPSSIISDISADFYVSQV